MSSSLRILVTGASGFLGRQVADTLSHQHQVTRQGFRRAEGVEVCDLRDPVAVAGLLEATSPDWIVHCAAYREPDFCELNEAEARRLNVDSTRHLLAGLPAGGRMLFVSSDYVFDGTHPPYQPGDAVCPVNAYGRHKAESEALVRAGAGHLVVRIPVLVGPDPAGVRGFLTQMIDDVRAGKPVTVDNVLVRCPTHIADVAAAFRFLIERGDSGVWHCSAPFAGTRYALTLEVARVLGLNASHVQPSRDVIPRPARRPVDASLDAAALLAAGFLGLRGMPAVIRALLEQRSGT